MKKITGTAPWRALTATALAVAMASPLQIAWASPETPAASPQATTQPTAATTSATAAPASATSTPLASSATTPAATTPTSTASPKPGEPGAINGATSVDIVQLSKPSQRTGSRFVYSISYSCAAPQKTVCGSGGVITVPLGAAANDAWSLTLATSPDVDTWSVVDGVLTIKLKDLATVSGTIGFSVTPPAGATPNNTSWSLQPTLTFANASAPNAVGSAVSSTTTATPGLSGVSKQSDVRFAQIGSTINYELYYYCQAGVGFEDATSVQLVDTLPAGLTLASASDSPTVSGQTITWTLSPDQIADSCINGRGSQTVFKVAATVDPGVADQTKLTNSTSVTETTLSGQTATQQASTPVTVVKYLPGGTSSKSGNGPILAAVGDPGASQFGTNQYLSATGPGGVAWYNININRVAATSTESLVDNMPCLDNHIGVTYSNAPYGSALCQHPAFNPTQISLNIYGSGSSGDPSQAVVTAVLTDGSTVALTATNGVFSIPAADVGKVAQVTLARTIGLQGDLSMEVRGTVASNLTNGDIVANEAQVTYYADAQPTTPGVVGSTGVGHVYIKSTVQIGVYKVGFWESGGNVNSTVPATADWQVQADISTMQQLQHGITIVDTLPAGLSLPTATDLTATVYSSVGGNGNSAQVTPRVTYQPQADGTTRIVATYSRTDLNPLITTGQTNVLRLIYTYRTPGLTKLGDYTNTVDAYLNDPALDTTQCYPYGGTPITTDPSNLDANDATQFHCESQATVVLSPVVGSNAMGVSKAVKGTLESDYHTYPAVGVVPAAGGSASFKLDWTNYSAGDVKNVVLYDVFPYPGDHGTTTLTAGIPRNSTFAPTLTGLPTLPDGVTVSYSMSTNPCRPEVAQAAGCVDDWTSTAPADLGQVKAMRFVYAGDRASGQGIEITYPMTAPAITTDQSAWNSVAAAATDAVTGVQLPTTESSPVGIARSDFSHFTYNKSIIGTTQNGQTLPAPTSATAGQNLTYQVRVVNDGLNPLGDFHISDQIPAHTSFVSASQGGAAAGSTVTWDIPSLNVGEVFLATVTVHVNGDAVSTQPLVNRLTTSSTVPHSPVQPCADNPNDVCTSIPVTPSSNMVLHKGVDKATAAPGDTLTYTLTVTNLGEAPGTIAGFYDVLPAGVTFVSASIPSQAASQSLLMLQPDQPLTVQPGQSVAVTITATVNSGEWNATETNGALAVSPDPGRYPNGMLPGDLNCPQGYNGFGFLGMDVSAAQSCAVTITPAEGPAITLTKTASTPLNGTAFVAGETITYTFHVTNVGNDDLTDVAVTDTSFTNAAGAKLSLATGPTPVTIASLPRGASVDVTGTYVVTQADVDAHGPLSNTATVTSTAPNGDHPTATAKATAPVANPSISLTKTATQPTTEAAGGVITYTFTATNTGTVPLKNVTLSEDSFTNGAGTAVKLDADPAVTLPAGWNGTLNPGDVVVWNATYTLKQADIDAGHAIANTATVHGVPDYANDPNPASVTSSSQAVVPPTTGPAIRLVKTASAPANGKAFVAGETVTYTFAVTNVGNVTLDGVALADDSFTDAAGKALTLASAPAPTTPFGGELAPGQTVIYTATYTVTIANVAAGERIDNAAHVDATSPDGTKVSASDHVTILDAIPAPVPPVTPGAPVSVPAPASSSLAHTGAPDVAFPAIVALALLAMGAVGVRRGRRG